MLKGFISYAHEDRAECEILARHLAPLRDIGLIDFWADNRIFPGSDWAADINAALEGCDIAAFLVSSSLYHSNFVRGTELPRALERQADGKCLVVPVLLKSFLFELFDGLNRLHPLPEWDRFLDEWHPSDAGLLKVSKGFKSLAERRRAIGHV